MTCKNLTLITLNNTLHIKADNLEPVEVDSSCIDNLIDDVWFEKRKTRLINEIPNAINLMEGINISELSDRIEVRNCTKYINTESYSVPVVCKRAFLLPVKEIDDSLNVVLDNQHEKEDLLPDFDSPRNWTEDYTHENGNYMNRCSNCKEGFFGNKRRFICKECDSKAIHIQFTNKKSYTIEEIENAISIFVAGEQTLDTDPFEVIINNLKK